MLLGCGHYIGWNPKTAPKYIITKNAPALADAPFGLSEESLRFPHNRLARRWQIFTGRWRRIGPHVNRRAERRHVPNYRYADWLRGPLRPLLNDVLTDPRTQARPYFRQATVQRWLTEHLAGIDHSSKLAALLALELTIRTLISVD